MKAFLLLIFLFQVTSIRSDSASEYDAMKAAVQANYETAMSDMVNVFLDRGVEYQAGHEYLRQNIINRLLKLHGTCIWAGREIFKSYTTILSSMKFFFRFSSLRSSFDALDSISSTVISMVEESYTLILQEADAAKKESCWTAHSADFQQSFDDLIGSIEPAVQAGPTTFDSDIDPIEAERLANFQAHEAMFRAKGYTWNKIGAYVRYHELVEKLF